MTIHKIIASFAGYLSFMLLFCCSALAHEADVPKQTTSYDFISKPEVLVPRDSRLNVAVGEVAPDFTLPTLKGQSLSLHQFQGQKNVVLSFVPAAWTPVCSDQWPGYNIARQLFSQYDTVLLGISVDNIPTLHAWVKYMGGLWFDVLSDFWPHGHVAESYGVLRSNGTAERALVYINKHGIITAIQVADINVRPLLEDIVEELQKFGD